MILIDKIAGYRSTVINALIDAVRAQRIVPGPGLRALETPAGTTLTIAPEPVMLGCPYGPAFAFGITIAGAAVTIHPGAVRVAGAAYTTAETAITITADGQCIGIAFDRGAGTATITGPHNARPTPSGDVWADALYYFSLANGRARLLRECVRDIRLEVGL